MKARMVIALLSLVGTFIALYLTLYKVGVIGQLSCSVGSCEAVNTSQWAVFLGLPVAAWGLGAYIVMLALALAGIQPALEESRAISWALVAVSGWSLLFSLWLTYLELFVIHAICMYCVISAVIVALLFMASLADLAEARRNQPPGNQETGATNRFPDPRSSPFLSLGPSFLVTGSWLLVPGLWPLI